jgi:hypothetical protein
MEQERILANPTQSGGLSDEPELKAALAGITDILAPESVLRESLRNVDADLKRVIVCVTTLGTIGRLIPGPLRSCHHMVADRDGGRGLRHKGSKEPPFSLGKVLDRDSAQLTARPGRLSLIKYVLDLRLVHVWSCLPLSDCSIRRTRFSSIQRRVHPR